jgi:quinol monooxygenase YgiN
MLGLEILVRVAKEKRQEFLQTCEFLAQAKDRIGACVGQTLFEGVGDTNRFLFVEQWTDSDLLESYLASDRFRTLLGAIEVLGKLEDLRIVEFKQLTNRQDKTTPAAP